MKRDTHIKSMSVIFAIFDVLLDLQMTPSALHAWIPVDLGNDCSLLASRHFPIERPHC
jgi:hypothetical protein